MLNGKIKNISKFLLDLITLKEKVKKKEVKVTKKMRDFCKQYSSSYKNYNSKKI